jgi:DNA invertase Pin-like site-specific DNA recombinase
LIEDLKSRGVGFRSLTDPIDTTSPQGLMIFQIVGALAEFERSLIQERTRAGLAAARRRGIQLGRKKKILPGSKVIRHARKLIKGGESVGDVAATLKVGRSTLYRALKD